MKFTPKYLLVFLGTLSLSFTSESHSSIDISLVGDSIKVKNNTTEGHEISIRLFLEDGVKGPAGGHPFQKNLDNGLYEGNSFEEWFYKGEKNLPVILPNQDINLSGGWGYKADTKIKSSEILLKEGACSEPLPRCDAEAITINQLKALAQTKQYYSSTYRYDGGDYLGKHGGKYSAGLWDSFCGETQFQFARPNEDYKVNNTLVSFDDKKWDGGPMVWMALSSNQEYFGYDLQYMIAKGSKETWFMTGQPNNDQGISIPMEAVNDGAYTPFEIEGASFGDLVLTYPKVYPHQHVVPSDKYLGPAGLGNQKLVSSAWMFNGIFSSGTFLAALYEQLSISTDLGWKELLENSWSGGDPYVGMCEMSALYNRGPVETTILGQLLPKSKGGIREDIMDNPDACNIMKTGFGDYILQIKEIISKIENASKAAQTDSSIEIIDYWITKSDLKRFWFGEGGDPSTSPKTMNGGVMKQYNLTQTKRQEIWDLVSTAFDFQAEHWPSQNGKAVISLRYDWISNLRIAKGSLDRTLGKFSSDWKINLGINYFSKGQSDANGVRIDTTYPFVEKAGKTLLEVDGSATLTLKAADPFHDKTKDQWDRGIESIEWTFNDDWSVFRNQGVSTKPTLGTIHEGQWEITFDKETVGKIEEGKLPNSAWIKVSDSCGNKVVKRVALNVSSRPTPPKINSAWIYDTDGDGNGDQIHIEGFDNPSDSNAISFNSFDSLSYSWPELKKSFSVAKLDIDIQGNYIILNNKELGSSSDKIQGSIKIDYFQGNTALANIFKDGISDSIGPVIRFASIQEKASAEELDSLKVQFSREVTQIDLEIMYSYFQFDSEIKITQDFVIQQDEKRFIFIYPAGTITPGDSIKIKPNLETELIAKFNNRSASSNNQKVEIILDQGVIYVADNGNEFQDKDGDGRLDFIKLTLSRPVDQNRLSQMEIKFNWIKNDFEDLTQISEFTFAASDCDTDDGVVLNCSLSDSSQFGKLITYFEENSWGDLWITQPDFQSETGVSEQKVLMKDAMGPILLSALFIKSSNPNKDNEQLSLRFTETILSSQVNGNQLFDYLIEKNLESFEHNPEIIWLSKQTGARVIIEPLMDRASIGDLIRIRTVSGEPNLIQDLAGNFAHPQNPWVTITGKQVIQFFFNEMTTIPEESYNKENEFEDLLFFEKGENFSEQLIKNNNLGAGFSFSFKDSINTMAERKKVVFNYNLSIYDQLGQFVISTSSNFNCTDIENYMKEHNSLSDLSEACNPAVVGASREIRSFIPWNFRSNEGRIVGAGTYILNIKAWSQKESSTLYPKEEIQKTIGVNR